MRNKANNQEILTSQPTPLMAKFSFKVEFNSTNEYLTIYINGLLKYESSLHAFDQAVNDKEFHLGMGRIWNLTHADFSDFMDDDICMASSYSSNFPKGISDVKVAFVSENSDNFKLLNQYRYISAKVETFMSIFDSLDKARDWIINKNQNSAF